MDGGDLDPCATQSIRVAMGRGGPHHHGHRLEFQMIPMVQDILATGEWAFTVQGRRSSHQAFTHSSSHLRPSDLLSWYSRSFSGLRMVSNMLFNLYGMEMSTTPHEPTTCYPIPSVVPLAGVLAFGSMGLSWANPIDCRQVHGLPRGGAGGSSF